jgi:hypothetical protein
MNSKIFAVFILIVLLGVILVVAYVLLVPIEYEPACTKFCKNEGYSNGFCRQASVEGNEIRKIEMQENANLTDGMCTLNPIALNMKDFPRCFCKN